MASAKRTIEHEEIRRWVEQRGGFPAHVKRTSEQDDPGILRVDYPGYSGRESLERIDWDTWLSAFENNNLAFLYQDEADSRFSKLVRRTDEEEEEASHATSSGGARRDAGAGGESRARRRWRSRTEPVTINDASREELDALYGIGPQNARRIVEHRRRNGPFQSPEDLQEVNGIDGETARIIREQVSFE